MNKKFAVFPVLILSLVLLGHAEPARAAAGSEGEQAFIKDCALCHPGGKNIITPTKTLSRKSLAAHGIKDAAGIVAQMRNPGPGMTKFDEKAIPDETAKAIAEYILTTFR